jgi:hypothetical protein
VDECYVEVEASTRCQVRASPPTPSGSVVPLGPGTAHRVDLVLRGAEPPLLGPALVIEGPLRLREFEDLHYRAAIRPVPAMGTVPMNPLLKQLLAAATIGLIACNVNKHPGGESQRRGEASRLQGDLRVEIARILAKEGRVAPQGVDSLEYVEMHSHVWPDVKYVWVRYLGTDRAPLYPTYAVAAVRGGVHKVIRSVDDWDSMIAGRDPSSATDALLACNELVRSVRSFLGPDSTSIVSYSQDPGQLRHLVDEDSVRFAAKAAQPSSVRVPSASDSMWTVEQWFVLNYIQAVAIRARCRFPSTGTAARTQFAVIDSIIGVEHPYAL